MPRTARLDMPGILQHVIVRGIEKRNIFLDDEDKTSFIERLSSLLQKTETSCFAWALLSNHFHLLLMPTSTPLSTLMRRLLTGYAVVFNRKHLRSGHLFQNRYKSIVCEEETYLLELVRYIHLNPLRAGLVSNLDELDRYRWCGHAVLMGNLHVEGQEIKAILERFGNSISHARREYRQYLADGVSIGRCDNLVGGGLRRSQGEKISGDDCESFDERILGSGSFVESLKQEEMLRDRIITRLTLPELTERVCSVLQLEQESVRAPSKARAPAEARGIICYIATRDLGYKGKNVGQELHLGPTGVSIAVRRGEKLIIHKPELRREVLTGAIDK
jgi:REP-associated tyrosine transposase